MDSRTRGSQDQFATLLAFMGVHGDLARPVPGAQGKIKSDRLWQEISNVLNAMGGGVTKTTDKWKKVWADWKSKTKKKALALRRHASGTGGGPAKTVNLTAAEETILSIIGPLAVEGQGSTKELGFTRPQSSASSQNSPAAIYLEVIDEVPIRSLSPSPPPASTHPFAYSDFSLQPSTSRGLSPALSSTLNFSVHPSTCRGMSPAPPTPATPPRQRRPPVSRALATPPSSRRRLRSTTPATPQSAASLRRPHVRARRRRAQTPFEKAASEFAAVELRRLEMEQTRDKRQHERELRALEMEQTRATQLHDRELREIENDRRRTEVMNSFVNVAEAFLECYRSSIQDKRDTE